VYTEYRVAVDVGGTFTDLIAMDSRRKGRGYSSPRLFR